MSKLEGGKKVIGGGREKFKLMLKHALYYYVYALWLSLITQLGEGKLGLILVSSENP